MRRDIRRTTPEEFFAAMPPEESPARGHLKIFLGYASGVGKSFRMFDEARRRRERGQDVVVGAVQPKVPAEVQILLETLEIIPFRKFGDESAMDIEAILKRRPAVCVIDGLAFNNPPGSLYPTRWQDVERLAEAGIKVIGTINIQYIEEWSAQVEAITGKHVTETVPASFVKGADEIEIVDAPAQESIGHSREQRMNVQLRQEQYTVLREMALILAAEVVDHQLSDYLKLHGIKQHFGMRERILVCITPRANIADMIEKARRIADRFHAEWIVAYVRQPALSTQDHLLIEEKLAAAKGAGSEVALLDGEDPVDVLLDFARSRSITQLFIGHTRSFKRWPWRDPVDKLIRRSRGMDLHIFPQ